MLGVNTNISETTVSNIVNSTNVIDILNDSSIREELIQSYATHLATTNINESKLANNLSQMVDLIQDITQSNDAEITGCVQITDAEIVQSNEAMQQMEASVKAFVSASQHLQALYEDQFSSEKDVTQGATADQSASSSADQTSSADLSTTAKTTQENFSFRDVVGNIKQSTQFATQPVRYVGKTVNEILNQIALDNSYGKKRETYYRGNNGWAFKNSTRRRKRLASPDTPVNEKMEKFKYSNNIISNIMFGRVLKEKFLPLLKVSTNISKTDISNQVNNTNQVSMTTKQSQDIKQEINSAISKVSEIVNKVNTEQNATQSIEATQKASQGSKLKIGGTGNCPLTISGTKLLQINKASQSMVMDIVAQALAENDISATAKIMAVDMLTGGQLTENSQVTTTETKQAAEAEVVNDVTTEQSNGTNMVTIIIIIVVAIAALILLPKLLGSLDRKDGRSPYFKDDGYRPIRGGYRPYRPYSLDYY